MKVHYITINVLLQHILLDLLYSTNAADFVSPNRIYVPASIVHALLAGKLNT